MLITMLITLKNLSHVKSNSKPSRVPETMHLNNTFRNKLYEKAELINNYFYEKFSGPSVYNTHIRVHKFLSNIISNKASGPGGIHGKVLKKYSESLAYRSVTLKKILTIQVVYQINGSWQMSFLFTKKAARIRFRSPYSLFFLYINDLHQGISTETHIGMYADELMTQKFGGQ